MQIENITVGVRSDGRVVIVLSAVEKDANGNPVEVAFHMPPKLATATSEDLASAAVRALARVEKPSTDPPATS